MAFRLGARPVHFGLERHESALPLRALAAGHAQPDQEVFERSERRHIEPVDPLAADRLVPDEAYRAQDTQVATDRWPGYGEGARNRAGARSARRGPAQPLGSDGEDRHSGRPADPTWI